MKAHLNLHHEKRDSKNAEWYTPPWVFKELNMEFNLDPCHPLETLKWIPAKNHFSVWDDGLRKCWSGSVWLNPPYGGETKRWLAKMHEHRNGVALTFARTDTSWFHEYVVKADGLLFLRGRVQFVDGLGVTNASGSPCGSVLAAWGKRFAKALKQMSDRGWYQSAA